MSERPSQAEVGLAPARPGFYAGQVATLATMHGKEAAVAPPFCELLDVAVRVPDGINTDALGTFTGEIQRPGDMLETARLKAKAGIELTGAALALASEGAYGPHPWLPSLATGVELLLWVDTAIGIEVCEQVPVRQTAYGTLTIRPGDSLDAFLERVDFPRHALAVMPGTPAPGTTLLPAKGLRERAALERAIRTAAAGSEDGQAVVQTDMRAHVNPTRMESIAALARRLATRLISHCEVCDAPGFGIVGQQSGLPCAVCDTPTALAKADIHGCARCDHRTTLPRARGDRQGTADPRYCDNCNP
ncbi:MAG: DUF6671 family protein [Woeseiaceae bacterium]|nr:DUF6671 family protein [Woeseiaceae bacterium]